MKINPRFPSVAIFLFFTCFIQLSAQPVEKDLTVDSVSFKAFYSNDSAFSNYISPRLHAVYRMAGVSSSSLLQQANSFRALVQNPDGVTLSRLSLNTEGVFLTAFESTSRSSSLKLSLDKTEINAKETWINGEWIRVPIIEINPKQDSALPVGALSYIRKTKSLMISNGTVMGPAHWEIADGVELLPSVLEYSNRTWLESVGYNKIPVIRLRHPQNVTGLDLGNESLSRDFSIVPYQYGMAIDYNGVVECWVGEWSIHKGMNYKKDLENNGNTGWGGVLWVGDDADRGGVRATARNRDGLLYSEISSETFDSQTHGALRLRVIDSSEQIQFVHGGRGSSKQSASINRLTDTTFFNVGQQLSFAIKTSNTNRLFIGKTGLIGVNNSAPSSALDINGMNGYNQLRLRSSFTPINSSDQLGETGEVSWDNQYFYIKTTDGWKRTKLESF